MSDEKIKRILFQTVGTGGPNNPVWEALAFCVHDRRPQMLVQWCSRETIGTTVPRFEDSLGEAGWLVEVRRSVCVDANDVDELVCRYLKEVDELRKGFPDAEMEVDFTSGTKPMSAAAVAVAVARRLPRLHYATGPKDETGRALRTDRLVSVDTGQMVADRLLGELGRLFDQGQFGAVWTQAQPLARQLADPLLQARAESLAVLAQAYDAWDRFAWKEAFSLLREYPKKETRSGCFSRAGWDREKLHAQVTHLKYCKSSSPPRHQRLVDLLANAERRLRQGRCDDAVARLYRLVEYVAQLRFRSVFKIGKVDNPTGKVPLDVLASHAPQLASQRRIQTRAEENKVDLGLRDTIEALCEAGDSLGAYLTPRYKGSDPARQEKKGPLGRLLDKRNNSWLAHGIEPVRREMAEEFFKEVFAVVDRLLQEEGVHLVDAIRPAQFLACPWAAGG